MEDIHLWEDTDGDWMVTESDVRPVRVTFGVAVEIAERIMRARQVDRLVVHRADGQTEVADGYESEESG